MSLVDADGKGTRQDCSLAYCYKKWFCGEKAGNNTPIRMVLPNNEYGLHQDGNTCSVQKGGGFFF